MPEIRLMDIRPSVLDFARRMEVVLRKHDAKKGGQINWRQSSISDLFKRLQEEMREALLAKSPSDRADELIDVANFAMMAHDVLVPLDEDEINQTSQP